MSAVLFELSDGTAELLGAARAGVSVGDSEGLLRFVTATNEAIGGLEQVQAESQQGPCHEAYTTGEIVAVTDLTGRDEWPDYGTAARQAGMVSVVGIPMVLNNRPFGALNVYDSTPRQWLPDELTVAASARRHRYRLRRPRLRTSTKPAG